MSNAQLATVEFHGQQLTVITGPNGDHLVAMKPICENIGLEWHAQRQRIKRHPVLSEGAVMITAPSKSGDQEYTCLPLDYLNGWLFGVDSNRVKPEIREKVIQYQRECFHVLASYFQKGEAINPRKTSKAKSLPNGLSTDQQDAIKQLVKARVESVPKDKQAKAAITCWSALKSKFGCTYKQIAQENYTEAVSLVSRIELDGEWLGKEESGLLLPAMDSSTLLPAAQAKEINDRLNRLSYLFNPLSEQFGDVLGISRALRGLHPRVGLPEPSFRQVIERIA